MTQPSTYNNTFDTSLIDTHLIQNRSFSSTETNTSASTGSNTKAALSTKARSEMAGTAEPFTAVSNDKLYDTWADTYDTDGNVLQAVDDLELKTILPEFVRLLVQKSATTAPGADDLALRILDFGCGTGRNTAKLLQVDWTQAGGDARTVEICGWDASEGMLKVAREKCAAVSVSANTTMVGFDKINFSDAAAIPAAAVGSFDAIISTLVLEHLPAELFFATLASLLRAGGHALVTNMHPDMGRTTRAGYKTANGERVKGDSYVHEVGESVAAAKRAGLEVVREVGERTVEGTMLERGEVGQRGSKWVGVKVWFGFVVRKR